MPPTLDPEIRDLMKQVKENLKDVPAIKAAQMQLEQEMKNLPANLRNTIDRKLSAMKDFSFDDRGRYRGLHANEDSARAFALVVIAGTAPADGMRGRALEMLQSDHSDVYEKRDVTGSEAMIPIEFSTRMHRLVEDSSVFALHAFHMPMSSELLSFQRRISGFRARLSKLRTAITKQDIQVAPVNLTAEDFDILVSYPDRLEEDTMGALGDLLAMEFVLGFSLAIEEDGMIGDGTANYDNIVGITSLLKTINGVDDGSGLVLATGAAGAGWDSIVKEDILKMVGRARYTRPGKTIFAGSNEFYWQVLAPIIVAAGGVTKAEMEGGFTLNVFGVPYKVCHVMPRTAGDSQVPLIYGDLGQAATLGDRKRVTVRRSTDLYFDSKQVAVLGSARYAINVHSLGDDTTPGPVVGLITPAAA